MSLSDLKKKQGLKTKRKLSVDEFIDGATSYAKGQLDNKESKSNNRNFKNATFTLTPDNIKQLQELSNLSDSAKSKIIRSLIQYLHDHPEHMDELLKYKDHITDQ